MLTGMWDEQDIKKSIEMSFFPFSYWWDKYQKLQKYFNVLAVALHPVNEWCTPNNIIYEHQTLRLRHFPNPEEATARRPVLILPPQAGHSSHLADYSPAQSLVRVFHRYGYDVYVTEWLSADPEYKDLGVADYIRLTDEAAEEIRRRTGIYKIHIIGQCQGGWQAAIYTSLYPEKIASLVIAASPIDVEAAPAAIVEYAKMPMEFFEYLVARGNGLMDGKYILMGFKSLQADEHYVRKYKRLWDMIEKEDEDWLKRFIRFENWYENTHFLPGRFYLDAIKNIFKENRLTKPGSWVLQGRPIDLGNITCPVIIMAGKKDHITPPPHVFALRKYVSTTQENIIEILTEGGHIGTLMGTESLREDWTRAAEVMKLVI